MRDVPPGIQLPAQLAEQPGALGDDVVLGDGLEVLLPRAHEDVVAQAAEVLDRASNRLAHAVLHEPRTTRRPLNHRDLVRALHQLVDLAGHRVFDDREQLRGVHLALVLLGQPEVERAQSPLVVRRYRYGLENPGELVVAEAIGGQALARASDNQLLGAWARRHPLGGDAHEPARAALRGDRRAEQREDLLGADPGHRCRLVLWIAGGDRHLRAQRVLALAHLDGDSLGELLGLEAALAEHHVADDVVDDLLEARHVRALLLRSEVDEAVEVGVIELLGTARTDADDLPHVRDPDARERHSDCRGRRLYIGDPGKWPRLHRLRSVSSCFGAARRLSDALWD